MAERYEFDWDPAKAAVNLSKHKLSFDEAMTVFVDPLALSIPDPNYDTEERWITIGMSAATRLLVVIHTDVEITDDHIYILV